MTHYALWLTEEQKNSILKYIQDRRYSYMISMYAVFLLTTAMLLTALPTFLMIVTGHSSWLDNLEILTYCAIVMIFSVSMFLRGIGKIFGKNSDYDCLKQDNYQLDFLEFGDKLPDTGKHPYYVKDKFGNHYICPIFLDYRNARQGSTLICIALSNGKKYALLEKIDLQK